MEISISINEQYKRLTNASETKSLLKKHLTPEIFEKLRDKKTKYGGTLSQVINQGVEHFDATTGVRATDPHAYETFRPLFDAVIKDWHNIPKDIEIRHPAPYFGDLEMLQHTDLDPEQKYIKSTRVRVGRNLQGYPLQSLLSVDDRAEVEAKIKSAVFRLSNEHKCTYHSLETMSAEEEKSMIENHLLFNHSNRYARAAGVYRDWPKNRGIFMNRNKTFLVWIGEEDQMRIISMQPGGRLGEVYSRLVNGVRLIGENLKFAHSDRLGYITFCPTNLGTTLRASVHIQIPKLAANNQLLNSICKKHRLQVRGIHGDKTAVFGDTFDISNRRRLGLTEWEAVLEMEAGVKKIIEAEQNLST